MNLSGEYLFHCFPSRFAALNQPDKAGNPALERKYASCGLSILESILVNGMLLTPERIRIHRHPGSEQEREPPIELSQTRASFTLSTLEALQAANPYSRANLSHLDMFGQFSIGLEPLAARDFDMAPVYYYYDVHREQTSSCDPGSYPLIASLVHSLTETREILSVLALLERRAATAGGGSAPSEERIAAQFDKAKIDLLYQTSSRASRIARAIEELAPSEVGRVLRALDTDRRPFWNLVEAIDLMSGLLQRADSASLDTAMLYFSQREWRLVKVRSERVVGYDLVPDSHDEVSEVATARSEQLRALQQVALLTGTRLDIDWLRKCWVVLASGRSNRHFRDYIRVVTCPRKCVQSVKALVSHVFNGSPPAIVPIDTNPQ